MGKTVEAEAAVIGVGNAVTGTGATGLGIHASRGAAKATPSAPGAAVISSYALTAHGHRRAGVPQHDIGAVHVPHAPPGAPAVHHKRGVAGMAQRISGQTGIVVLPECEIDIDGAGIAV